MDYRLYVLDREKQSIIHDVTKILSTKTIDKKLLAVEDIDRITGGKRSALILYDANISAANARVRNSS